MKGLLKQLIFLSIALLFYPNSIAQISSSENTSLNEVTLSFPPLNVVIDSVLKRSGMVNFRNHSIQVKEAVLASERRYWTKNFGAQVDAKYGNINNTLTNGGTGSGSSTVLTTTQQFTYSAGFYLKFPLFDGINRKNQIQLAKSEVEAAKSMAVFEKEEIRKAVIVLYQDLILKQKILQIKSESLGDGRVNMQMVEKEFRNGVVPIAEYVRIKGMTSDMEEEYETAMSEFIISKKVLEDMAGFVFGLKQFN